MHEWLVSAWLLQAINDVVRLCPMAETVGHNDMVAVKSCHLLLPLVIMVDLGNVGVYVCVCVCMMVL